MVLETPKNCQVPVRCEKNFLETSYEEYKNCILHKNAPKNDYQKITSP
jgi:hypothetical protein